MITLFLTLFGISIEPEFQPYVDSFRDEARARSAVYRGDVEYLSVQFGAPSIPGMIATCDIDAGVGIITIDKRYWDNRDDEGRTVLMYHELGHCLLGREHNIRPGEVMYKEAPESFGKDRERVLFNLFGGVRRD